MIEQDSYPLARLEAMLRLNSAAYRIIAGLCIAASAFPFPARAMKFDTTRLDNNTVFIAASGLVEPGDSERLMSVFLSLSHEGVNILSLNSAGGNVVASEALAATIRRVRAQVMVGGHSMCASACFILFASSPIKYYMPGARIGVHSATREQYETVDSMAVTTAMARSAAEMGVPNAIIGRMVSTPPGDMAWLSESELASMGAQRLNPPSSSTSAQQPAQATIGPSASSVTTASVDVPGIRHKEGIPKDEQSPSFQQGRIDRSSWEQWFGTLSGDSRLGAEYWTGERSKRQPGNCGGTYEFANGCRSAKARLSVPDTKRKSDPQYWWGWNSPS